MNTINGRLFILFLLTIYGLTSLASAAAEFPSKKSQWHGFDRYDFEFPHTSGARKAIVVTPKQAAVGKPWIWRARFFGHQPQADLQLLDRGFHLVYCDVANLFGCTQAVDIWNGFYRYLTEQHGFAKKAALEGMSRGGLIIYNWAAANPDKVACIYADAPVCDFKSWPGGKGKSKGSPAAWRTCKLNYGLTESAALEYDRNPIDNLKPLAKAGVPLLHVVGLADEVVPVAENTDILRQRYEKLGGSIQVIAKKGVGHHPHSLKDPAPIVQFVLRHAAVKQSNIHLRGSFHNAWLQFQRKKTGHVAFIGGSITQMNGYRPMVYEVLKRRFPDTKFTFTDAGISSTCSTTGAFRLKRDVLDKGPVDLFFIEFAVNDDQDAHHSRHECIRGLEGIIRQTRKHNPLADIVVTYFVNPSMLETIQKGNTPLTISSHNQVVRHYNVSTIDLASEVARRIDAGSLTWKKYGGTHPAPHGNAIAASMIDELFAQAWTKPLPEKAALVIHDAPESPLDPLSYASGRFIDPAIADCDQQWKLQKPDRKTIPGQWRERFRNIPMLCAEQPGAALTLKFHGTAAGIYIVAGPDAGMLEVSVDGGPRRLVNLYHHYSKGLHYPRTVMLATDLKPGEHTLQVRVAKQTKSKGNAVRIIQFTAN